MGLQKKTKADGSFQKYKVRYIAISFKKIQSVE